MWSQLKTRIRNSAHEESGASAIEFGLIVGLSAMILVATITDTL